VKEASILTQSEKSSATARAHHEARQAAFREALNDRRRAAEVCRAVRDDASSTAADKLWACEILMKLEQR